VCNKSLRLKQAGDFVQEARTWAKRLEEHEAQGGTLDDARRRLQTRYGIPPQAFWSLRHRPPKRIAADIYHRIRFAYLDQCQRIVRSAQVDINRLNKGQDHAAAARLEFEAQDLARAIENARGRKR
jgi:hypothetical protein